MKYDELGKIFVAKLKKTFPRRVRNLFGLAYFVKYHDKVIGTVELMRLDLYHDDAPVVSVGEERRVKVTTEEEFDRYLRKAKGKMELLMKM